VTSDYLYINAIRFNKVHRTPIWIMRQAGRYLPEYHKVRGKYDFLTVCKTPELAGEVTLQPIRRFQFDAAIMFSDILVIPEALGQKLEFLENHGPKLSPQILTEQDFKKLDSNDIEHKLNYVAEAIKFINSELPKDVPLIGFSGSPLTLATYMIEGKPTRNFKYIKTMLYKNPILLKNILQMLKKSVSEYLKMQIKAGVKAIQIFDTWGGILPPHLYEEFSGRYMKEIVDDLKPLGVPITLFSKGGIDLLKILANSNADMLGVDWMTSIKDAKKLVDRKTALQGNLDPTIL
jgi:uroporphyrinogen decarboxylase